MLVVLRQRLHDLDGLYILREHHLTLGAVDVVAYVILLGGVRRRRHDLRSGAAVQGRTSASASRGRCYGVLRRGWRRRTELELQYVVISRVGFELRVEESPSEWISGSFGGCALRSPIEPGLCFFYHADLESMSTAIRG